MIDLAVVALEVVLNDDLPVGGGVVRPAPVEMKTLNVYARLRDQFRQAAKGVGERRRIEIGVDEGHRSPRVDLNRAQPETARIEVRLAVRARCGTKGSVEVIGPGMIRALKGSLIACPETDPGASVATYVDESPQLIVSVPHKYDRNTPLLVRHEVAGLGELLMAGEILPRRGEKLFLLDLCHSGIAIPGPGNRPG